MNPDPVNPFNKEIILASASPARKSILEQAGFRVTVMPTFADEEIVHAFPGDSVEHLAKHKLTVLLNSKAIPENIAVPVITADTMVLANLTAVKKLISCFQLYPGIRIQYIPDMQYISRTSKLCTLVGIGRILHFSH